MRPLACATLAAALSLPAPALAQEAAAPPWSARPPRPAHAPAPAPAEPVADFNVDGAGRVTLVVESAGRAQRVVFEQRRRETTTWTRGAPPNILGSGTCTTPCALHVPPGPLVVRAEGAGLRDTDSVFDAPEYDARVRLRAASQSQWNVGIGMVAVGATMVLALAGLALAAQTSGGPELSPGSVIAVGAGAGVLLGVGIPLLVFNATGVERVAPLTRPR